MRLGCLLTTAALLVSLVVEPPKAKAFAVTSSAVSALAGGFLNACGLAPVVSGMGSSSEVNESIARLLQDYLNKEVGGQSILEWAGDIAVSAKDGKLIVSKLLVDKLAQFAVWVASKYATKPGMNVVYSEQGYFLSTGEQMTFAVMASGGVIIHQGTIFEPEKTYWINGHSMIYSNGYFFIDGEQKKYIGKPDPDEVYYAFISSGYTLDAIYSPGIGFLQYRSDFSYRTNPFNPGFTFASVFGEPVAESLSLDVAETAQQILDRLTALEEGQSVALDVGATQSMEIQEILQGILDAILAGNLSATAEIVDEAAVPVDPPAETLPDVDGLGLPALGVALTSRFPFSIPWDVYKGISLLAAPAKAPYFEVDFMAPIADEVGGWKGSTRIVLDFSEFEIIGQVCRWTSTIGFCLMLATATKRLIWTA